MWRGLWIWIFEWAIVCPCDHYPWYIGPHFTLLVVITPDAYLSNIGISTIFLYFCTGLTRATTLVQILIMDRFPRGCSFSWICAKFQWAPDFVEFVLGSFSCFNTDWNCLFKLHFLWGLNSQFLWDHIKNVQISAKRAHPQLPLWCKS